MRLFFYWAKYVSHYFPFPYCCGVVIAFSVLLRDYISILSPVLMAWRLAKHRNNLTLKYLYSYIEDIILLWLRMIYNNTIILGGMDVVFGMFEVYIIRNT